MMSLLYLLFAFLCAAIVILLFVGIGCIASLNSRPKTQEDEEQMEWLINYQSTQIK